MSSFRSSVLVVAVWFFLPTAVFAAELKVGSYSGDGGEVIVSEIKGLVYIKIIKEKRIYAYLGERENLNSRLSDLQATDVISFIQSEDIKGKNLIYYTVGMKFKDGKLDFVAFKGGVPEVDISVSDLCLEPDSGAVEDVSTDSCNGPMTQANCMVDFQKKCYQRWE